MQTLDVISVNLWQIAVSLLNLALLFWIVKKFLYKPAKRMLEQRENTIQEQYDAAQAAQAAAQADKAAYEQQLQTAKMQADRVIQSAVDLAGAREKEIIQQAQDKADGIIRQAQLDADLERRKALDDIKQEIVEVSSQLAQKMIEREMTAQDHKRLIDSFIEDMEDTDADR